MSVFIANYRVGTHRDIRGGFVRSLYLETELSETGTFKHFAIYFLETMDDSLGYVNPDNGFVVPFLPTSDFKDMYHILQTEKRVYANWYADESNELLWFQIGTQEEPLGEGFTDTQP